MAITSASTYAQVEAEYRDTAGYLANDSLDEARRHAIAIRHLLVLLPSATSKGSSSVSFRVDLLKDELERAESFALMKGAANTNRFVRADFSQMRKHG